MSLVYGIAWKWREAWVLGETPPSMDGKIISININGEKAELLYRLPISAFGGQWYMFDHPCDVDALTLTAPATVEVILKGTPS